jgi:hypothetical protein
LNQDERGQGLNRLKARSGLRQSRKRPGQSQDKIWTGKVLDHDRTCRTHGSRTEKAWIEKDLDRVMAKVDKVKTGKGLYRKWPGQEKVWIGFESGRRRITPRQSQHIVGLETR